MPKNDVLWEIDDHTMGKHAVLEAYLKAWLPIMGTRQDRILFVDGFAGPGEYRDGQVGSPVIAMRALSDHSARGLIRAEVNFFFVESDRDRYRHLTGLVDGWRPKLPANSRVHVECGTFDQTMTRILDSVGARQVLIPAFVMVDPFGVGQTPMALLHRLLGNPRVEIFVSVMYDFINRFKTQPEFEDKLDSLYGTTAWRDGLALKDGGVRKEFFYNLYKSQLRAGGAKHVVHFDLYRKGRPVYAIFHATGHSLGCDKMKEAIWKIAPFGDFIFRSGAADVDDLFGADMSPLKRQLRAEFGGEPITVERLTEFVASERCLFHSGQLKGVLKEMEVSGELVADESSRKKRRTYPNGTLLTLAPL